MRFLDVSSRWKKVICLVVLGLTAAGCFNHPGDSAMPSFDAAVPVKPVYDPIDELNNSYLEAQGSCNGNTSILFTWSSEYTPSATKEVSCSGDKIDAHLAVVRGNIHQTFKVQMIARLRNIKSAPITITVAYNPPPPIEPGRAILSGGGLTTGTGVQVFSAIGEVLNPAIVKGPAGSDTLVHTGVRGTAGDFNP